MALLRVLVACPATGKSTWCQDHRDTVGEVLSTDQARAEIGAGEHDQSVSAAAFDRVERWAAHHLAAGRDVVIDATGAHHRDRARWIALAAKHNAKPIAVVMRCRLWTALLRNRRRAHRVPVKVLVRMWWALRRTSPPQLLVEGFAAVQLVQTDHPRRTPLP